MSNDVYSVLVTLWVAFMIAASFAMLFAIDWMLNKEGWMRFLIAAVVFLSAMGYVTAKVLIALDQLVPF